jgi:hypothetical protein
MAVGSALRATSVGVLMLAAAACGDDTGSPERGDSGRSWLQRGRRRAAARYGADERAQRAQLLAGVVSDGPAPPAAMGRP